MALAIRLWWWLMLALGAAESRIGLGLELARLRLDAEAFDDWSWLLAAEAQQRRIDAELERLLQEASGDGTP
ncbi:hypothetical protein ACFVIM_01815 [Streptomyces sp. NPDC057638]|uniref:hypothetical protein n=1 Tax=Streptomyces sp. NPDC057638 TaxID=3346190 RepID=UPI00369D7CBB